MAINDSFLQELKMKTDIEDIVSTYVTLKKRGSTYVGLCPFHNEKTPSFTLYPDTQSFYCFGCGAGGDAVGFIKRIENLDYIDAVKLLAQRAGMQMPDDKSFDDSIGKRRRRIFEANRAAAKFFHSYMLSEEGRVGLNYLKSRNLAAKTIKNFGLGYAPDKWDGLLKHLKSEGFSISEMADAGLIVKSSKNNSYYDNFRNRVMFPIIDVRGNVIAFGGRIMDKTTPNKYLNTRDTLAYKKTNELYGLNIAKDNADKGLILCEGYMDVIAMHQAGFTNAIGGCGTALTAEQVKLISRYTDTVILCYDMDGAGRKAVDKAIRLFKNTNIKIRIPNLTGGKDPDEIINNVGVERFGEMLKASSNDIEYALVNLGAEYDLTSSQGKVEYLNEAIRFLTDTTPIEQDIYTSRLAEELGVSKESINAQLKDYKRRSKRYNQKRNLENKLNENRRNLQKESYEISATPRKIKAQDRLIGLLLKYPEHFNECKDLDKEMLSEGFIRKVYSLTEDLIEKGFETDPMNFSQYLSDSELGRLSGIRARFNNSISPKDEIKDCVNVIKEEFKGNNSPEIDKLSDEEFRKLFNSNT
ncbi:MAG: DNA primase [Eubacterium sp.]|nr:DNA primase [Eubacterium sp.]